MAEKHEHARLSMAFYWRVAFHCMAADEWTFMTCGANLRNFIYFNL